MRPIILLGRELGVRLEVFRNPLLKFHTTAHNVTTRAVQVVRMVRMVLALLLRGQTESEGLIGPWAVENGGIAQPADRNVEGLGYVPTVSFG